MAERAGGGRIPCTGVILAGGAASRFGFVAKGLLPVGGVRMIDRVHAALREVCDSVIIIANDPGASEWIPGVPVYEDIYRGYAGLGGIHAALRHAGTGVIVVAWDMPLVPPSLLQALREAGVEGDAVLPASGSRRGVEPLCAWYSQACIPAIEAALESGARTPIAFHESVRLRVLSFAEVARHGEGGEIFMNVNTVEDLAIAEAFLVKRGSSPGEPLR